MTGQMVAAFVVAVLGAVSAVGGWIAAAAAGDDVAPLVQGGGTAASVGALIYITRKLLAGELVPRDVAATERHFSEVESRLTRLVEQGVEREQRQDEREQAFASIVSEQNRLIGRLETRL